MCELDVERERAQAPGEAMFGAGEGADLCHVVVLSVGGGEVVGEPVNGWLAHHWKRPSPASSVQTGSARPMTERRENGPK